MAFGDLNNNGIPDWEDIAETAGKGYEYVTGGGLKEDATNVWNKGVSTVNKGIDYATDSWRGLNDSWNSGKEKQANFNDVVDMAPGANNVGIDDLTIGISAAGMEEYKKNLKAYLLTQSVDKINDTSTLEAAINNGWQGASRDVFMEKFNQMRESIVNDLSKEFDDLSARLEELEEDYFAQDNKMIDII